MVSSFPTDKLTQIEALEQVIAKQFWKTTINDTLLNISFRFVFRSKNLKPNEEEAIMEFEILMMWEINSGANNKQMYAPIYFVCYLLNFKLKQTCDELKKSSASLIVTPLALVISVLCCYCLVTIILWSK